VTFSSGFVMTFCRLWDLCQYPLEVLWIAISAADQVPDRSKLLPALEYWPGAEMHELARLHRYWPRISVVGGLAL